jgi:enoyl-CoA hydratase
VLDGPKGNALSPGLVADLGSAVADLAAGDDVVVLVESAHPRAFMVGGDVDVFADWAAHGVLHERWAALAAEAAAVLARLQDLPAVKIGVAHAAAVGGGLELLLMCDHRIAATGIKLGFPEVRMGVYPAGGSVRPLVEAVGRSRALRLLLGGALIEAEEALAIGLVDEVSPAAEVRARAHALADELSEADPAVLRAIRRELASDVDVHETMRSLLAAQDPGELAARVEAQRARRGAAT